MNDFAESDQGSSKEVLDSVPVDLHVLPSQSHHTDQGSSWSHLSNYARRGRMADLKRLAEEMLPIFSSLQIHREALAALSYLQQAIAAERVGEELVSAVTAVAEYLRRAQHRPELRFEGPE